MFRTMYRTILIDPPWPEKKLGSLLGKRKFKSAEDVYPVMSLENIAAMPIGDYALKGCHLWLWATNAQLPNAFPILKRWGFKYHAPIVWRKKSGGGNYFLHHTEFLLFAYFDKCYFNRARFIPNVYDWPKPKPTRGPDGQIIRGHSAKPEGSYKLIESVSDDERLEIFCREKRPGWDAFGNQIESDLIIPTGQALPVKLFT